MNSAAKPLPVGIAISDSSLLKHSQASLRALLPTAVSAYEMPQTGAELIASVAAAPPAVLVADLQSLGHAFGDTIRVLRAQARPPEVIVLHNASDGGAILKAIRAGAREFLFEDIERSLSDTIAAIAAENRGPEPVGKLYAFLAAKGGCGVTTLASYTAAILAQDPDRRVLLADLHWESPSTAFLLRSHSKYSLESAALKMDRMDHALWGAMVSTTDYGFDLAPPPAEDGMKDAVEPASLGALLGFCKTQYGNIVADCGHGLNSSTSTMVKAADEIVLVTSTEVVALHHAKRLLRLLQGIGESAPVRLVLNRAGRRSDMANSELEKILEYPIFASVPNDYRALKDASERGALLPFQHPLVQSVSAFATQLAGAAPAAKRKRFGLFGKG